MNNYKLVISGSRNFNNYNLMKAELDKLLCEIKKEKEVIIISGCARGTDILGIKYAEENNFSIKKYPANWDIHGKQAGYIRNLEMLRGCDAVVCFWDSKSKGTKHMINSAREVGKLLSVIEYEKKTKEEPEQELEKD